VISDDDDNNDGDDNIMMVCMMVMMTIFMMMMLRMGMMVMLDGDYGDAMYITMVVNKLIKENPLNQIPSLCGYLYKRGEKGLVNLWKKRWFSIRKDKLYYFKSKSEVIPINFIDIRTIVSINIFEPDDLTSWMNVISLLFHHHHHHHNHHHHHHHHEIHQ
jgi:hypothetical protein